MGVSPIFSYSFPWTFRVAPFFSLKKPNDSGRVPVLRSQSERVMQFLWRFLSGWERVILHAALLRWYMHIYIYMYTYVCMRIVYDTYMYHINLPLTKTNYRIHVVAHTRTIVCSCIKKKCRVILLMLQKSQGQPPFGCFWNPVNNGIFSQSQLEVGSLSYYLRGFTHPSTDDRRGGTKSLQEDGVRRSEGCKVPGPSKIESKFVGWEELCQFPEGYIGTCMYCVCRCRCIYIYMYYMNIGLYIYIYISCLLYENVYAHTFWFWFRAWGDFKLFGTAWFVGS